MRNNNEYHLCKQIANYLRFQYPQVIFHFDLAGLNLSKAQAGMMKGIQGKRGFPDLFISQTSGIYSGLFLEIKTETPFKKDGTLKKNEHLEEQADMLLSLRMRGYYAVFGVQFDSTIKIINEYLKLKEGEQMK